MKVLDAPKWNRFKAAAKSGRALVALDNDGVLSPIVEDPTLAAPTGEVLQEIRALSSVAEVAVISGRTMTYLRANFSSADVCLVGLYGRQALIRGQRLDHPAAVARVRDVARGEEFIRGALRSRGISPGDLRFENKDGLTFGVSWRPLVSRLANARHHHGVGLLASGEVAELESRLRAVEREVPMAFRSAAAITGLDPLVGRVSAELAVPGIDKGTGLLDTVRHLEALNASIQAVMYLGDEARDRPAWVAMDVLERRGIACVRGLVENAEAGDELRRSVDIILDGTTEVPALLVEVRQLVTRSLPLGRTAVL